MPLPRLIAIPCKLNLGVVSGERVFVVRLADGNDYVAIAPRQFCWNERGELVMEEEPADEAEGFVAARLIEQLDETQAAVEVPDGAVIAVDIKCIKPRPTEISPPQNGPAQSERKENVPIRQRS
jgi:hypothetical protein